MPTVFVVDRGAMRGSSSLLEVAREAGFHTLPMADADMALAVLNAIRADLLLVDLRNAEADGSRLIDEVRRKDDLRRMPILAVGARAGRDDVPRLARRVGNGHVLVEGEYSHEELVHEIRKHLMKPAEPFADVSLEWTN